MTYRNTFTVLFICLLFSCKKGGSKSEINFPLMLQTENLVKKSETRLFTANGEIKDQNIIKQFIKNESSFIVPDHYVADGSSLFFSTNDVATIGGNVNYSVVKDGDLILFYSPKTVLTNNQLIDQIFKYRAPITPITTQNGHNFITQEVRVARGNYDKFSFSRTVFLLKRGATSKQSGIAFNDIADDMVSKLSAQDTLAYLETALIMAR